MKIKEILEAPVVGAHYFQEPFERELLEEIIKWFRKNVDLDKFDLIVGSGVSGSSIVPVLAYVLKKRFALVRKGGERSHAIGELVAGNIEPNDRWIFVDDFMESGKTLRRVKRAIERQTTRYTIGSGTNWKLTYVGHVLYSNNGFNHDISPEIFKPPRKKRYAELKSSSLKL